MYLVGRKIPDTHEATKTASRSPLHCVAESSANDNAKKSQSISVRHLIVEACEKYDLLPFDGVFSGLVSELLFHSARGCFVAVVRKRCENALRLDLNQFRSTVLRARDHQRLLKEIVHIHSAKYVRQVQGAESCGSCKGNYVHLGGR